VPDADGTQIPYDIRKGVWVCIEADTDYVRRCFKEYSVVTDPSGRYMSMYRRWHMIGLELGISVASVGLRGEPTGIATCFNADVVATAKRDLAPGEMLDGEGGYTVFGKLVPAERSLAQGGLPLGLAHHLKLVRPVGKDQLLNWQDVAIDENQPAVKARREMETIFAPRVLPSALPSPLIGPMRNIERTARGSASELDRTRSGAPRLSRCGRHFFRIGRMADQSGIMPDRIGPAQQVTLDFVDRFPRQEFQLGGAFDTLGDDRKTETMRKAHHGAHDGRGLMMCSRLEMKDWSILILSNGKACR